MKKLLFLFSLALFSQLLFSQETDEKKDQFRNKGYFNITRFSYIGVGNIKQDLFVPTVGNSSTDLPSDDAKAFSLQTINGYFFSPYFSAGIGFGLDGYHTPDINTMPAFLDLRAYLNDDYNSAFFFLDWGTLIDAGDNFHKGNMFNIGAGYKVFVSKQKRIALMPEIGYSVKNISMTDEKVRTSDNVLNITGVHIGIGIII
jgi:hypothetical protein